MVRKRRPEDKTHIYRIIGIAGSGKGVGVTHFCVLAANYLAGFEGRKTAVLEWNRHGDFERMERVCTGSNGKEKCFSVLGVSYYKNADGESLEECISSGCSHVIIDFGVYDEVRKEEFFVCEKRILIGSFTEWQEEKFLCCLKKKSKEKDCWIYAAAFGSEESRKEVRKKLKIPVLQIPYAEDAFTVTSVLIKFFRDFFEG